MEVPQNTAKELPYDPAMPLLGIYLDKTNLKRYMYPSVLVALFTTNKTWKQTKCPLLDEWIKENIVHIC